MIRVLRVARRGAMKARVAAAEQRYGVLYSAPEELRAPLLGLKTKELVRACFRASTGCCCSARSWAGSEAMTAIDELVPEQLWQAIQPLLPTPPPGLRRSTTRR
jgi:hypothetical protein